jgi:hypothetical protein
MRLELNYSWTFTGAKQMKKIELSELNPTGIELLQDEESFLKDLNENEIEIITGGDLIGLKFVGIGGKAQLQKVDNPFAGRTINAVTVGNFNSIA